MKYTVPLGCGLLLSGLLSHAAEDGIAGSFFIQGKAEQAQPVSLPVSTVTRIRLFDRQTTYRNDNKACVTFSLPPFANTASNMMLHLQAYNDDKSYLRAVWFEVDGVGGYLSTHKVAPGQQRGSGTIGPGQLKDWQLPLAQLPIALKGEAKAEVNFQAMLQAPGSHTLCSWISTYLKYGPDAWITLDLVMED